VSNIVGINDDEGFNWTGPVQSGHKARLWHAHPSTVAAVVDLNDADLMTMQYLTLTGGQRGLHVRNGSTRFTGRYLELSNNTLDGILIEGDSEFTELHNLTVMNNGQYGIRATAAIDAIT